MTPSTHMTVLGIFSHLGNEPPLSKISRHRLRYALLRAQPYGTVGKFAPRTSHF